jgi:hypothetical protein
MNNGAASKSEDLFGVNPKKARWETVYRGAVAQFGGGAEGQFNPELELRLRIIRRMLGLDPLIWSDKVLAQLSRGHQGDNANSGFNRIKNKGDLKLDLPTASMLAGVVNYILTVEPLWPSRPSEDQKAQVIAWIEADGDLSTDRFLASDLYGDVLAMTRKLSSLVEMNDYGADPSVLRQNAHEEILRWLTAPYDVALQRRLVVQPTGVRQAGTTRFGSEMAAFGAPRDWLPVEFDPGDRIEYGLPARPKSPSKGWLVTIRDCRPEQVGENAPYVWSEGWDEVIRWFPGGPFDLPSGLEIRVPTSGGNRVMDVPGLFHLFLFVEPAASTTLVDLLQPGDGAPSVNSYLGFAGAVDEIAKTNPIEVYASSYLVPG